MEVTYCQVKLKPLKEGEAGVLRILEEHGYTVTWLDENHVFAEAIHRKQPRALDLAERIPDA